MEGFKNTTRTKYAGCPTSQGYNKGGSVKINKVMGEFAKGELHSGSKRGPGVTNRKQAVATALSEARKAGANIPLAKAKGGGSVARSAIPLTVKVK